MPRTTFAAGSRADEDGFTLIELMVVVMIIAILIAIAIPTFLGAKTRAQDKAAQSSLRNALTNAKSIYTDSDSYSGASAAALGASEPSLTFVPTDTPSTGPRFVSVNPTSGTIVMVALSASGNCFAIADSNQFGTAYGNLGGAPCTATTAGAAHVSVPTGAALSGGGWAASW